MVVIVIEYKYSLLLIINDRYIVVPQMSLKIVFKFECFIDGGDLDIILIENIFPFNYVPFIDIYKSNTKRKDLPSKRITSFLSWSRQKRSIT